MIARRAVAGAVVGFVGVASCLAGAQAVSFDPAVSHEWGQPYYPGATLPTPAAYDEGGYEVCSAFIYYGSFRPKPGAFEMVRDRAVGLVIGL